MAIAGDAAATDPACELSPHHERMRELVIVRADDYVYRGR
jgi:pyrroloquinoline quinone biosynthesis protein E